MSTSLLADPRVLTRIGEHLGRADLCSLLLVNKLTNTTLTPTLYSDIDLVECSATLKCVKTLAAAPGTRAFSRDLPALVNAFVLHVPADDLPWDADSKLFGTTMLTCIFRMVNLRKFASPIPLPFAPTILSMVVSGSRPKLQSIQLVVPKAKGSQLARVRPTTDHSKLPLLRTFKLDVWQPFDPTLARGIQSLLRLRANTLRALSLTTSLATSGSPNIVGPLLPSDVAFTALEELEIELTALSHPSLQHTAAIRALSIPGSLMDEDEIDLHDRLHHAFPVLESLAAPNSIVSEFFPEDTRHRRPIHTLRLNGASYGMGSLDYAGDESEWYDLEEILPLLRYSAVPIRDLSFAVVDLPLEDLPLVVPHLVTLHRLVVVFSDDFEADAADYLSELGQVLIAHLPELHTFLMSDMPVRVQHEDNGFEHAQDLPLQRKILAEWESYSSALRKVAFTSEFGWEKKGDQWFPASPASFV
ncbi:uncharacterized protein TRAVEDRAFT_73431 [Trametes versicolor FP-101664 SS1]|uniref:uncharacterized protein n=1 Tax=Trametes versicolor (strain FP-101664) TaxID=717944 RepID=UPI0004622FFA|nr:uncharacterized protein TRAVEDRAFT_73431 [Trametes versicolor FP-101664 SS1]EIW55578.1 hypothetical protein TRAVEDRAFT_73431 [Trametes versicolor FP-101664 SS1]